MDEVQNGFREVSPPSDGFVNQRLVTMRREGKLGLHIATAEGMVFPRVLKVLSSGTAYALGCFQAGDCILRVCGRLEAIALSRHGKRAVES